MPNRWIIVLILSLSSLCLQSPIAEADLLAAARLNQPTTVYRLIKAGANVNKKDNLGETPIFKTSNPVIADSLIRAGANINITNHMRNAPLHVAIQQGHTAVASVLINNGADVNARGQLGNAPLFFAVQNGNTPMCRLLIQKGAKVNARNDFGETPLFDAMVNKNKEIIELLLRKGSVVNARNKKGASLLHRMAKIKHSSALLHWLIIHGIKVNTKQKDGNTALHQAAGIGSLDNVMALASHGANMGLTNKAGRSVMYLAVRSNNKPLVDYLLKRGARANPGDFNHCQKNKVLNNTGLAGYVVRCFNKKEYYTNRAGQHICAGKNYNQCFN